ncbi:MAG: hypothetical protein AAF490_10520 [Chloroflexota bacterium]
MTRVAQILCALFVLVLGGSAIVSIFSPLTIFDPVGFTAVDNYGVTNMRTLGAPTLSLAIFTAIAAVRKEWLLVLPVSMYFFFNFSARLISIFAEGYEPVMLRGLLLTIVLFILSQVALNIFRTSEVSKK